MPRPILRVLMLLADTYMDRIDFLRYLPQTDCTECGAKTCQEFVQDLKQGRKKPQECPHLSENLCYAFRVALDADNLLPKFPCLTAPRPGPTGLVEINTPYDDSPILISGNNIHTQDVITSILATTRSPFFLVFADTKGDTVDMAVIYKSLTAEQIRKDVQASRVLDRTSHQEIIIPGLAGTVGDELKESTGWNVTVGPICAGELPLFLADRWLALGT
jgi:CO dehydrogenase/acetyl-CoA synthase gamma subunit (corrinoid Fe-S protein)